MLRAIVLMLRKRNNKVLLLLTLWKITKNMMLTTTNVKMIWQKIMNAKMMKNARKT